MLLYAGDGEIQILTCQTLRFAAADAFGPVMIVVGCPGAIIVVFAACGGQNGLFSCAAYCAGFQNVAVFGSRWCNSYFIVIVSGRRGGLLSGDYLPASTTMATLGLAACCASGCNGRILYKRVCDFRDFFAVGKNGIAYAAMTLLFVTGFLAGGGFIGFVYDFGMRSQFGDFFAVGKNGIADAAMTLLLVTGFLTGGGLVRLV